ncbi:restriction endonuclease subunit S [Pseudomonas sp.]|uniref:restriction endonuclease subunit S n=1 Tax=Pseudomonas sp. TaxID=306 RepID=UPI002489CEF9|nr:restriction endonuclease subunit S [Pseudomonas sp.]MDI1329468.1 restriction endonuclease subunit S [Pseudomonas sp.]
MARVYDPYPEYKKSEVEWLGDIPLHWNCVRLKYSADLGGNKIEASSVQRYVGMENIEPGNGRYIAKEDITPEGLSTSFLKGDVLFGKLRPYLAKSWLAEFSGICSSEFLVLRSKNVSPRFLHYYTLTDEFINQVDASTYGSKMPRASWDFIGLMPVPIPDTGSEKISNFLDHETAIIDTMIERQQQLIQLLKEKRQAVISHAVTKGLDSKSKMRDSGVEWLGQIPESWNICRFKFLVKESSAGPYGSSLTKSMYTSSGVRVYGQQQVIPNDFSYGDYYISEEKFNEMKRYEVYPGDILISVMGTIGKVAVVPSGIERGIINPRLVKYRSREEVILPEFVQASILSEVSQSQLLFAAQGSTMDGLNMQIIGELPIAYPETDEQVEILRAIERHSKKFNSILSAADQAVTLLQERRSALISAAVTGKIDVRNWVAPQDSQTNKEVAA